MILSNHITLEYLEQFKSNDNLVFTCKYCNKESDRSVKNIKKSIVLKGEVRCQKCAYNCFSLNKGTIITQCNNCNKNIKTKLSTQKKSKTGLFFCSSSCAASYNNTHKTHGHRRSKMEVFIEEQIRINYPELLLVCNEKTVINSELDFYFPKLKFAIELNGILHYEPIYGDKKFNQIQNNDNKKELNYVSLILQLVDI
jgi:hypothetical protein